MRSVDVEDATRSTEGVQSVPTLPPTVHERLARCGTEVLVTGLAGGADVEVDVGGAVTAFTATSGQRNLAVAPLGAGDPVRARQDDGSGFTPWSPAVVVEDVELPPQAAPRLPTEVGVCSHCVQIGGMVPGSRVEVRVGGQLVGSGRADRHGGGCVGIDLVHLGGDPPGALTAVSEVCGQPSPPGAAPLVVEPPMGEPAVLGPLFGCQRVVPLDAVHRGARVRLESTAGPLGGFCSCWRRVDVGIGAPLVAGTSVRAQPHHDGRGACDRDGPWSAWEPVVDPDERIAPTIGAPLVEGDRILRVSGQIPGATRVVTIVLPDGAVKDWGPVPSDDQLEIALAEPLEAGSTVTVTQTLCAVSATSDPVVVLPAPPRVLAPTIIPPLHACGARVQVSGLHAGALVRLFSDGIPMGVGWAGMASSTPVTAAPSLVQGRRITATQEVGGVVSDPSDPVEVVRFKALHRPRIVGPVAVGDTGVLVSGLTPGCRATIEADGTVIGQAHVAETLARVPLWTPVDGTLSVAVDLCGLSATGDRVRPVASPCSAGPLSTGAQDLTFADWDVPQTDDGVAFTTRVRGVAYHPIDGGGAPDRDLTGLPLVVIAHGYWDAEWLDPDTGQVEPIESFRGYDYLGHHLASWGMLVVSIDMDDVNASTTATFQMHTFARGEIVLHAVDEVLAHPVLGDMADPDRLAVIGHSMSGEGVIAAQQLNRDEGRGYGLRGVVSLAPTRHRDDIVVSDTDYLQLYGSMDQLNFGAVGPGARFAGVRTYDGAARPKTHAWVHGLRHNPFNRRWVATTDFAEGAYADRAAPAADHELVARCLITAFLLRAVAGRAEYAGYVHGQVLPSGLDHVPVHLQHSTGPRTVVDNFGDADAQVGLAAAGLDGTTNSLGMAVTVVPAGSLVPLEDVALVTLPRTSHDTNGLRFAWAAPGTTYRSQAQVAAAATGAVALRAGQLHDDVAANMPGLAADAFVLLRDAGGAVAQVRLGSSSTIPYPDHDLTSDDGPDPLSMMRTVVLPLDAFTAAAPGFAIGAITSIELVLSARPTGHLILDDLELWG